MRYVMIAAVILKIAALAVIIAVLPHLPRDFALIIIGLLTVTILVQTRLILRQRKKKRGRTIPMQ